MSHRARRSHSKDSGVSANNQSLDNSTVSDLLGSLSNGNTKLSVIVSLPRTAVVNQVLKVVGVRKSTRIEADDASFTFGPEHEDLDFEFETNQDMNEFKDQQRGGNVTSDRHVSSPKYEATTCNETVCSDRTVKGLPPSPYANSLKSNQSNYERNFGPRSIYLQRLDVPDNAINFRKNYLPYATSNLDCASVHPSLIDSSDEEDEWLQSEDGNGRTSDKVGDIDEDKLLCDSGNNSLVSKTFDSESEDSNSSLEAVNNGTQVSCKTGLNNNMTQHSIKNGIIGKASNFAVTINVSSNERDVVPKTVSNKNLSGEQSSKRKHFLTTEDRAELESSSSQFTAKKKRRWDQKFNTVPLRLTSLDNPVKYNPEENEVSLTSAESSNFKVTVTGNNKIVVTPAKELKLGPFKMPLKRPPTRLKSKSQGFENSSTSPTTSRCSERISCYPNIQLTRNIKPDVTDDVISLLGSTTIDDTDEERELFIKSEPDSDRVDKEVNENVQADDEQQRLEVHSQVKVQEWIKSTQDARSSSSNNSNTIENESPKIIHRGSLFKDKPAIFKGFCFRYFFDNYCRYNISCKIPHVIPNAKFTRCLKEATPDELLSAYRFSLRFPRFYQNAHDFFAVAFAEQKMKDSLVALVDDIYNFNLDALLGIKNVLKLLTENKLCSSLEEAVDYVSTQTKVLSDIISSKPVCNYWPVIKELTSGTKKLDSELASKLIERVTSTGDRSFCKEVYQHIVGKNKIDLELVSDATMLKFRKFVLEYESTQHRDIGAIIEKKLNMQRESVELESQRRLKFEPPRQIANNFTPENANIGQFRRISPWASETDFSKRSPLIQPPSEWPRSPEVFTEVPSSSTSGPFTQYLGRNDLFKLQPAATNSPNPIEKPSPVHTRPLDVRPRVRQYDRFSSEDEMPNESTVESCGPHGSRQGKHYETDSVSSSGASARLLFSPISSGVIPAREPAEYNLHGETYDPQKDYVPLPKNDKPINNNNAIIKPVVRANTPNANQVEAVPADAKLFNTPTRKTTPNKPIIQVIQDVCISSPCNKRPETPVFGRVGLDNNYELESSLHVLYTQRIDRIDIDEDDVLKLNSTIVTGDGPTYLELLEKYKPPATIQNFITMSIAHLKGMNQMVYKVYVKLLKSIEESNPTYFGNKTIRVVLEVITMNLLFELEKRLMWEQALQLLETFTYWDTLITSRLFEHQVTLIGRYFLIAKILVFANKCHSLTYAYELLQCPSLHLLEAPEKWPYQCPKGIDADLQWRDIVLREFFRQGYLNNPVVVDQLYKKAKEGKIYKYDALLHIPHMISVLVNDPKPNIATLKQLFSSNMDLYVSAVDKDHLRAVFCLLCNSIGVADAYKLFDKCVEKGIYTAIKGSDRNIVVRTNMLDQEIELIVKYYFSKVTQSRSVPSSNLIFTIELPPKSSIVKSLKLLDSTRSVHEINLKLREILHKHNIDKVKSLGYIQLEVDMQALREVFGMEDDLESVFSEYV